MRRPTVLCIGTISDAAAEWQALGAKYELLEFCTGTRAQFLSNCRDGTYDAVVGCYRSNGSTRLTGPFDAELVGALPPAWRYVAHNGAGYDTVDVEACSRRKIAVSNTPGAVDDATADVGMFLLLGALRSESPPFSSFPLFYPYFLHPSSYCCFRGSDTSAPLEHRIIYPGYRD